MVGYEVSFAASVVMRTKSKECRFKVSTTVVLDDENPDRS